MRGVSNVQHMDLLPNNGVDYAVRFVEHLPQFRLASQDMLTGETETTRHLVERSDLHFECFEPSGRDIEGTL